MDPMVKIYGLDDYVCPECGWLIDSPPHDYGCPNGQFSRPPEPLPHGASPSEALAPINQKQAAARPEKGNDCGSV